MNAPSTYVSKTGLSPTVARLRMGNTLRELRESVNMTLDDAARVLQRSAPTLSRLETGKTGKPREIEVILLLDAYDRRRSGVVTEQVRRDLLALVYDARQEVWFHRFRDVLAGDMVNEDQRRYLELENDAVRVQSYESELMPGLLQTRSYVQAIARTYYPDAGPDQHERFVELRMRRTEVLKRPERPLEFHVVLSEVVLRRAPGGPRVQHEQLDALRDYIRDGPPNVTIQMAPLELAIPAVIGGPFVVMSFDEEGPDDLIYLEGRSGADYQQSPAQLTTYGRFFAALTAEAYDERATLAALEKVIERLDR